MKRRTFINNLSKFLILFFLPVLGCEDNSNPNLYSFLESYLSRIFSEEIILKIGKEYQELYPFEANEVKLNQLLLKSNVANGKLATSLEFRTKKLIMDDFDDNNIVLIHGWYLSRTEARQCALFEILKR